MLIWTQAVCILGLILPKHWGKILLSTRCNALWILSCSSLAGGNSDYSQPCVSLEDCSICFFLEFVFLALDRFVNTHVLTSTIHMYWPVLSWRVRGEPLQIPQILFLCRSLDPGIPANSSRLCLSGLSYLSPQFTEAIGFYLGFSFLSHGLESLTRE